MRCSIWVSLVTSRWALPALLGPANDGACADFALSAGFPANAVFQSLRQGVEMSVGYAALPRWGARSRGRYVRPFRERRVQWRHYWVGRS